jgi:hypothetical protein
LTTGGAWLLGSDSTDLEDEADVTFVKGAVSESFDIDLAGRTGTCGFDLAGTGGAVLSVGDEVAEVEWTSTVFCFAGRAGIWGFKVDAIPVVARPSSSARSIPAAAFSWW